MVKNENSNLSVQEFCSEFKDEILSAAAQGKCHVLHSASTLHITYLLWTMLYHTEAICIEEIGGYTGHKIRQPGSAGVFVLVFVTWGCGF